MPIFTAMVVRPTGIPHSVEARPRVTVRPSVAGRVGTMFVDDGPVHFDVVEGIVELDLLAGVTDAAGRLVPVEISVDWLDPHGVSVPGGYSEWGRFWLGANGGPLAGFQKPPPDCPVLFVQATDPSVYGVLVPGSLWLNIGNGELKEWRG